MIQEYTENINKLKQSLNEKEERILNLESENVIISQFLLLSNICD